MRSGLLLLAFVAAATAYPAVKTIVADKVALEKQYEILVLLESPLEPIRDDKMRAVAKTFDITKYIDKFDDKVAVKYLFDSFKVGHLQKQGMPFTTDIVELRKEFTILLRVFLGAVDYKTFMHVACWARTYLNTEQFIAAFTLAVLQRLDTKGILLPPMYEVFPYNFFDARIIQEAQNIYSVGYTAKSGKSIVISMNNTVWRNEEVGILDYWLKDLGLNSYYSYFWLTGLTDERKFTKIPEDTEYSKWMISRGSRFIETNMNLLARYNFELCSNYLNPFNPHHNKHVLKPFYSNLRYVNGLEMPGRTADIYNVIANKQGLERMNEFKRRISDFIDLGYVISKKGNMVPLFTGPKGYAMLGDIMEGLGRSFNPRYFGNVLTLTREYFSGRYQTLNVLDPRPSVLQNSATMLRDETWFTDGMGWILENVMRYRSALIPHTYKQLFFDGVKIESVTISKLTTFFEEKEYDIDAAVFKNRYNSTTEQTVFKTVKERLNHKPYTFKIALNSDKAVDGVVRVFMRPKYDQYGRINNIRENTWQFIQMDQFFVKLNQGQTIIERNSFESPMFGVDTLPKKEILRRVKLAMDSHETFHAAQIAEMLGFPEHLALPKGRTNGFDVQMCFIVSDLIPHNISNIPVIPNILQTFNKYDDYDPIKYDVVTGAKYETGYPSSYGLYHSVESGEQYLGDQIKDRHTRSTTESKILETGFWDKYYEDKHLVNIAGSGVSIDGRPYAYPFDRPLAKGAFFVPNIKCVDVKIFHEGEYNSYGKYNKTIPFESNEEHVGV